MDERNCWPKVVYSMKITMSLVQVLRLVDGEQTPAMGFIYGAMDGCKEKIAKNLDNNIASYKEIWDIIDTKGEMQMHCDLHVAAYYLNPQYRWSPNVFEHPEIKRGLYDVMERLMKDTAVYLKIEDQLIAYKEKKIGLFGYKGSLSHIRHIHLSMFNQIHTKRRNQLNTVRMNNLVYIMYNKKLKQKFIKRTKLKENDPLVVEQVLSDDEWIAAPSDGEEDDIGGGGELGEEDGGAIGRPRGGGITERLKGGGTIGEGNGTRKQKNVKVNLIDEDDGVQWGQEDEGDLLESDVNDVDYYI
uniref:Uncharacterized protein n=1 Tax=Lactuca sativa TaxID=4236 RepID=A0A9R1VM49_LACSA|nr:hypothetical protein LSAT_V11C500294580 [Lactuca sativa]